MSRLLNLVKELNEVKKEIVSEIAEPIQKLINLIHEDKLSDLFINVAKTSMISEKGYITVTVTLPSNNNKQVKKAFLGGGGLKIEHLASESTVKSMSPELKKELSDINNHLNAINDHLSTAIPVKTENAYYFSKNRLNEVGGWKKEDVTKDFGMIPDFLKDAVNLNGTLETKSKPPKP